MRLSYCPHFTVLRLKLALQALIFPVLLTGSLFLIFLPLAIFRWFLSAYVKSQEKEYSSILPSKSAVLSTDELYKCPQFNSIIVLLFSGQITEELLKNALNENIFQLSLHEELRQYPEKVWGFPFWKWDKEFHVDKHIRLHSSNPKFRYRHEDLVQIQAQLLRAPWQPNRSLWEFVIVQNCCYNHSPLVEEKISDGSAVIFRYHQSVADGRGAAKLLMKIFGIEDTVQLKDTEYPEFTCWGKVIRMISSILLAPYEIMWYYKFCRNKNWHSPHQFMRQHYIDVSGKISLQFIHKIMRKHDVSFTAVIQALLSGGLRQHLIDVLVTTPERVHALSTLSFPGNSNNLTGNCTYITINSGIELEETHDRLQKCESSFQRLKRSTLPTAIYWLMELLFTLPPAILKNFPNNYCQSTTVLTNFAGPSTEVEWKGQRLTDIWGVQDFVSRHTAFGLTVISYHGHFRLVLATDNCIITSQYETNKLLEKICGELFKLEKDVEKDLDEKTAYLQKYRTYSPP